MQVSIRWLKDYVPIAEPPEILARRLTMAGLEVEAVERRDPPFSKVVVARIVSIKPHPKADKLTLCEVTDGHEILSIVCGAKNIHVGDLVPLAKIGARLPDGTTIRDVVLRGEQSMGMLCSEKELGLSDDASGVMVISRGGKILSETLKSYFAVEGEKPLNLGCDLGEILDLTEVILHVSVTPNRADCLSVIGVAREIAVLTDSELRYPTFLVPETDEKVDGVTSVTILAPDLCPRYTARVIKDVKIKPSPLWMRLRLAGAGMRAINNVVDVTNFVMLEMGQPLHAFDFSNLAGNRIIVRPSREGETFTTLDGKERRLRADICLICDGEKPVAIGGIMGGMNSEVTDNTETVLLESAYFNPISIRASAKWLGLVTDAAYRFERGVDPEGVLRAQNRATALMSDLTEGKVLKGVIDVYPKELTKVENLILRLPRLWSVSGAHIKAEEVNSLLSRLEMIVERKDESTFLVTPPSFRRDVEREIDLIEEIVRIKGYDTVPVTLPRVRLDPVFKNKRLGVEEIIRRILAAQGFCEIISYSFISPQGIANLMFSPDDIRQRWVSIENPLTEDQSVMRTTLICGLLETLKKNVSVGTEDLKIFEIGRVFIDRGKQELPWEKNHLGCLVSGLWNPEDWQGKRAVDFYDLKGSLEHLFYALRVEKVSFSSEVNEPFLTRGRAATILIDGCSMGYLGELHPRTKELYDLKGNILVAEIDLDAFAEAISLSLSYREISRFPAIVRDVSLLVRKEITASALLHYVRQEREELLEKVSIFDIYEGERIPVELRSIGLRFVYRSKERTLTDEEVNDHHRKIVERIVKESGAQVRGW